jgi:tetratricopeptide (TPR) repeat protein
MWTRLKTPAILLNKLSYDGIRSCCLVWLACGLLCGGQGPTPSPDAATAFRLGVSALAAGDLDQAERDFNLVVRQDPSSGSAHANLGVVQMRRRSWDGALAELKKAAALSPQMVGIRLNMGLAFYHQGDFSAAIPEFAAVLQHEQRSTQPRYLLGLCYFFTESYKQAMDTLAQLWDQQSSNLTYLYVLGGAANKARNTALEVKAFQRMAEVGDGSPLFLLYSGKAALGKQDLTTAEHQLRAAVAAEPRLPMAHYFLARALAEQHRSREAREQLLEDIAIEPDVQWSYDELGRACLELGLTEEAEHAFRQAIERDRTLCTAYIGLAGIFRDAERYQDELDMLDRAGALQAHSASIHFMRGKALMNLHQPERAREEFRIAGGLQRNYYDQLAQPNAGSQAAEAQTAIPE